MLSFYGITAILLGIFGVNADDDTVCDVGDLRTMLVNVRHLQKNYDNFVEKYDTDKADLTKQLEVAQEINREQEKLIRSLLEQVNKSENEIANQQNLISELQENLHKTNRVNENQDVQIAEMNVSLQATMMEIESLKSVLNLTQKDIPDVAFIVRMTDVHMTCKSPMEFGTVIRNDGSAFDNSTNYFTAPYSGFYFFSLQLCTHVNSAFDFAIQTNTTVFAASRNGQTSDHTCTSVSTAVRLTNQEKVFAHIECPGKGTIEGHINDRFWTMFTGILLHY